MNRLIMQLLDTSALDIARGIKLTTKKIGNSWTKQNKSIIFNSDTFREHGKLVCGKEPEDFRDFQRVEAVSNWAQARGIRFKIAKPEDFANTLWDDVNAVWMPFLNPGENKDYETRCKEILNIPEHIPLILDIKSHVDHPWLKSIKKYLNHYIIGCRYVSPHDTENIFQIKVQYNHFPVDLPFSNDKNIIMLDIHHWEDLSRHIQLLGLLREFEKSHEKACRIAKCELKFFLTSFTQLDPYCEAIDNFIKNDYGTHNANGSIDNSLSIIRSNLIPPSETREDFLKILSQTRLFITFHNNLTDMLLFEALANEIPTAIISNSLIEGRIRNLWVPNRNEVPGYDAWIRKVEANLITLQGTDFKFFKNNCPSMNSKEILQNVFYNSWDSLWKWVKRNES